MTYYSNNFYEDFSPIYRREAHEFNELYTESQLEFQDLERSTEKFRQLDLPIKNELKSGNLSRKKRYFVFGSLIAFSLSILFLLARLLGSANSLKFPLTYTVAIYIFFGTAVALYAESKSVTFRKEKS